MAAGAGVGSMTVVGAGAGSVTLVAVGAGAGSGAVVTAGAGVGAGIAVARGSEVTSWVVVPIGAAVGEGSSPQASTKTEKEAKMRHRNSTFTATGFLRCFNPVLFAAGFFSTSDCNIGIPLELMSNSILRIFQIWQKYIFFRELPYILLSSN